MRLEASVDFNILQLHVAVFGSQDRKAWWETSTRHETWGSGCWVCPARNEFLNMVRLGRVPPHLPTNYLTLTDALEFPIASWLTDKTSSGDQPINLHGREHWMPHGDGYARR